jgi:hypothetical protein
VDDRALLSQVQQVISRVLSEVPFPGQSALLAQIPFLQIEGGPITFLTVAVDRDRAPRADFEHGHTPGFAGVFGQDGAPVGTVMVWVKDGYISALEYAWVTDDPPADLPEVEQIRFVRR